MSLRPDSRRNLSNIGESPPLGVYLVNILSTFLSMGYVLYGLFFVSESLLLASAWIGLGILHLFMAYGLSKATLWGWALAVGLYSLNTLLTVSGRYVGGANPWVTVLYVAILLYLLYTPRSRLVSARDMREPA